MFEDIVKKLQSYQHILLPGLFKIILFTCFTFIFSLIVDLDVSKILNRNQLVSFKLNKNVLVFVHIQKTTGGEFDSFLTQNLVYFDSEKECRMYNETKESYLNSQGKRVELLKTFKCTDKTDKTKESSNWYWGRNTVGWPCGEYPHLKMLKECVTKYYPRIDPERFHYITMIKDPVKRYISEWEHVAQGQTWTDDSQRPHCIYENYFTCFDGKKNWLDVDLKDFTDCEFNLANNRQTRLLSNSTYECDEKTDEEMLEEAKRNLQSLTFFGLTEYPTYTQRLFARMFTNNLKLTGEYVQLKSAISDSLNEAQRKKFLKKIRKLNSLDLELYDFAKELFFKRLKHYKVL